MELQKGLALPLLPYRLAVISAEDAAGYRDFTRHIQENPYGFRVCLDLFPALMQGPDCPASIISAMDAVLTSGEEYDAVLILRGGGARLDLACFDDYSLAAVIAQYPMPVLTAIGHDQDFHVCDMVAHEYVKTPTALADFILSMYEDEDARLSSFQTRMRLAFGGRISSMESSLDVLRSRIIGGFRLKVVSLDAALGVLQTRITASDPRRILEKGYALALDEKGRVLSGAAGRSPGDKVSLMFADGTLDCRVEDCRFKN